jgi:putative transposase
MELPVDHPQFITITVYKWQHLLKPNKYKQLIIDTLDHMVKEKKVKVFAFAIMSNHLHLIWQVLEPFERDEIQRDFLKYIAQQIKFDLLKKHPKVLPYFEVNNADRKYQFWKRNALSINLFSDEVFLQKLEYIHNNPVKAGLCILPEDYYFSSARFYLLNDTTFGFLSHYKGS